MDSPRQATIDDRLLAWVGRDLDRLGFVLRALAAQNYLPSQVDEGMSAGEVDILRSLIRVTLARASEEDREALAALLLKQDSRGEQSYLAHAEAEATDLGDLLQGLEVTDVEEAEPKPLVVPLRPAPTPVRTPKRAAATTPAPFRPENWDRPDNKARCAKNNAATSALGNNSLRVKMQQLDVASNNSRTTRSPAKPARSWGVVSNSEWSDITDVW